MGRARGPYQDPQAPSPGRAVTQPRTSPTKCTTQVNDLRLCGVHGLLSRSVQPDRGSLMADQPFHRSSDQGVSCSPVATNLQAGLRSLISALHGHVPPRLGRWAIPVRLVVSAACFTGGFVCARLFVECLLGEPGACPCVLPPSSSLVALGLGLVPLFATLLLTPAKTTPRLHRFVGVRVFSGLRQPLRRARRGPAMADISFILARAVIDGGVDSYDLDGAEPS